MNDTQPTSDAPRGPLHGIRVLDAGRFVAGPVTATLLGEFGADVIKIEHPGRGDDLRHLGWMKDSNSLWWAVEGRNKRSITLDLSKTAGAQVFRKLARTADVIVENFRPGTLERWGLGWEELSEENPGLILLRTSGFGQSGPYHVLPAFNTAVESLGGLRYLLGEPDGPPTRPGIALGDYTGALMGTIGVLVALYERVTGGDGRGQWIDNALFEGVMRLTEYTVPGFQHLQRVRERVGAGSAGTVPARAFLSSDGVWIGISAANDRMFGRLAGAMEDPDLATDPRFVTNSVRIENRDELHSIIERWCATHAEADIVGRLRDAEVSVAPVYPVDRMFTDEHIAARNSIVTVPDPVFGETAMQGVTPRLMRTPGNIRRAGPLLGDSNREILIDELGISPADFQSLVDAEVIRA